MSLCNALLIQLFFWGYTQAPIYLLHLGYVLTSTSSTSTYVALMMISQSPKQPTKAEKLHFTNSTFTRLLSPAYPLSMHSSIKRMTQFKLTLNKLYLMDFLQIFSFFLRHHMKWPLDLQPFVLQPTVTPFLPHT